MSKDELIGVLHTVANSLAMLPRDMPAPDVWYDTDDDADDDSGVIVDWVMGDTCLLTLTYTPRGHNTYLFVIDGKTGEGIIAETPQAHQDLTFAFESLRAYTRGQQ